METIPIASLEGLRDSSGKQLRGIVTLIWPYSSSTQSAAILLVEPDFRLRYRKGQVRVQLHGPAAVAVAGAKLGIGDEIALRLDGARWTEAERGVSTPGRSVDLELEFGARLDLQILQNNVARSEIHVHVLEYRKPVPKQPALSINETPRAATPALRRLAEDAATSTPVFHQRARLSSGSAVDSPLHPFGEDDDSSESHQRKRPRVSWGTPGRWRVSRNSPSPPKYSEEQHLDAFSLDSQQNQPSASDTPSPSDANSEATSPIGDAEMTQIVEDARQDFLSRKQTEHEAEPPQSSKLQPYRDPLPTMAAQPFVQSVNHDAIFTSRLRSPTVTPLSRRDIQGLSAGPTIPQSPDILIISSDSDSAGSEASQEPEELERSFQGHETSATERQAEGVQHDAQDLSLADVNQIAASSEHALAGVNAHQPLIDGQLSETMDRSAAHGPGPSVSNADLRQPSITEMLPPSLDTYIEPKAPALDPIVSTSLPLPSPFPDNQLADPFSSLLGPEDQTSSQLLHPALHDISQSEPSLALGASQADAALHVEVVPTSVLVTGEVDEPRLEEQLPESRRIREDGAHLINLGSHIDVALETQGTGSHWNSANLSNVVQTSQDVDLTADEPEQLKSMDSLSHNPGSISSASRLGPDRESVLPDGQGQPTRSDAESPTTELDHNQVPISTEKVIQLMEPSVVVSAPSPAESAYLKDEIDAIFAQVPSFNTYKSPRADVADDMQMSHDDIPSWSLGAEAQTEEIPVGERGSPELLHAVRQNDTAEAQESLSEAAEHAPLPDGGLVMHPVDPHGYSDVTRPHVVVISSGNVHPADFSPEQRSTSLHSIQNGRSNSPAPYYPDSSQQLRKQQSQEIEELHNNVFHATQTQDKTNRSAETLITHDSEQDVAQTTEIVASSSQIKAASQSSSAIDIMSFFGASSQPARIAPRLSAQTTAIASNLTAVERQLHDIPHSDFLVSQEQAHRRVSRRPGELRKILRVPEPYMPSPELLAASSQQLLRQSSTTGDEHWIKADGHDTEKPRNNISGIGEARRSSQSIVIDSIESENATQHDAQSQRAGSESQAPADPTPTMLTSTQSEVFTQSKIIGTPASQHSGLRTSYSYYVPLATLSDYLNKPSAYDSTIDVLAVVYRRTSPAARAEKGRRDWFTKLRITQPGFWRNTTLVQVFRGYKQAVPVARAGDVVLLRSFLVTGNERGGVALKSGDGSAWCVFKAGNDQEEEGEVSRGDKGEVMTGPPAEFGDEERRAAQDLVQWWKDMQDGDGDNADKEKSYL